MKSFRSPKNTLGDLDAEAAASLIAASCDIALILDERGVIRDLALNSDSLAEDLGGDAKLLGQPWLETVTIESRPKIEALLRDAGAKAEPRWRHINHPLSNEADLPILYSAIQVGDAARVVAFGRDLRALSALQQRLVAAQQSMERDYSRLRHIETRYRILFQMSAEAVLIADAATLRVGEANPAAVALFGEASKRATGRGLREIFAPESARTLDGLLAAAREGGRPDDVRMRLADSNRDVTASAILFRQEDASMFLVRLAPQNHEGLLTTIPQSKSNLLKVVENAPDGFVVTSVDGRIITANAAFLDMAGLAVEERARGEPLERWLDAAGTVLMANLRQHGIVRLFPTTLTAEFGAVAEVEVSAVAVQNGGQPCFGFAIRNVGRRLTGSAPRAARELPRSVEQLTELIGRVSLKDLVREATDVIERLCIEAALELTGDNRASAAEMLGLSRQSLYVKLRRYGLGDLAPENGG